MKETTATIARIELKKQKVLPSELSELIAFDLKFYITDSVVPASEAPPPLTLEELQKAETRGDEIYWLHTSNGTRAGYYWTEKRGDSLFLSAVVISTDFRNHRIGRQVLNWVDQSAKEYGLSRCSLAVVPINAPALHLYLSHGYRFISCNPNYFGDSAPHKFRAILEIKLDPQPDNGSTESIQVLCSDYPKLAEVTEGGYVGTSMVKSNTGTNYIVFQRRHTQVPPTKLKSSSAPPNGI